MTDTVKSWIEERRAVHRKRHVKRSAWSEATRDWAVEFPRALDALNAVLELHKPEFFGTKFDAENEPYEVFVCKECETYSPCPTVQAIERAINE